MENKMDFSRFTVIIPVLNEAGGIEALLEMLLKLYPGLNCIIADDGSQDATPDIVRKFSAKHDNVSLLDRKNEAVKGLSISVAHAIKVCRTEFFAVMDGDMQHPPEYLKFCFEKLEYGADIVIGTREPYAKKWMFSRIVISWTASSLARLRLLFSGVTVADPMSGFFGGRTSFVKELLEKYPSKIEAKGYKILFDLLKICPPFSRISGFYFPFGLRAYDNSKFSIRLVLIFLRSIFR